MGRDIVCGNAYLIKVNANKIYKHQIDEIITKYNYKINFQSDFNAFIVIDNTNCQRYDNVAKYKPINWSFSPYCEKLEKNIENITHPIMDELLKYKFINDYDNVYISFSDYIIEHGWYDIGFISY